MLIEKDNSDIFSQKKKLKNVMTCAVEKVYENDDINKVCEIMKTKQLHRLMVCDRNDKLLGIISLSDIAKRLDSKMLGEVVCEIHKEKGQACPGH